MSWFPPWRANSQPSRSGLCCIRLVRVSNMETRSVASENYSQDYRPPAARGAWLSILDRTRLGEEAKDRGTTMLHNSNRLLRAKKTVRRMFGGFGWIYVQQWRRRLREAGRALPL